MHVNTFSIVAYDPAEDSFGVAVASKFLAVGAVVPWAKAGIGAVATQAYCKMSFGPDGLDYMAQGKSAPETLALLLHNDPLIEQRQVGLVDNQGRSAAHTGKDCFNWAGHKTYDGFTCQGNILAGASVIDAMAAAYQSAQGELADRLLAALVAGDEAGGDRRGKQAAALLVVKANGSYGGDTDRYLDLRSDDDPKPIAKLADLVQMHHLYFGKPKPEDRLPINETLARELQAMLGSTGYLNAEPNGNWDVASKTAFNALVGSENLEERWRNDDPNVIDRVALEFLRGKFGSK
ncbi:MAG: DUF1028 domain-containing protein [Chloroflexi bacterium]|nr:DUF1028 domain-containing protein [Chloroflexota bacterium]